MLLLIYKNNYDDTVTTFPRGKLHLPKEKRSHHFKIKF